MSPADVYAATIIAARRQLILEKFGREDVYGLDEWNNRVFVGYRWYERQIVAVAA